MPAVQFHRTVSLSLLVASYDASGVMERTLVLDHAGFLADPKIGFLPDFWRRTMVKKLESIGEFGEGRPDFGGRRPAGEAAGKKRKKKGLRGQVSGGCGGSFLGARQPGASSPDPPCTRAT